jgi:hypothetical protein
MESMIVMKLFIDHLITLSIASCTTIFVSSMERHAGAARETRAISETSQTIGAIFWKPSPPVWKTPPILVEDGPIAY